MKNLLLLVLLAFIGCDPNSSPSVKETAVDTVIVDGAPPKIFTFDGHQYVKFSAGYSSWGAHYENCDSYDHRVHH